jgi:hypothetical protein
MVQINSEMSLLNFCLYAASILESVILKSYGTTVCQLNSHGQFLFWSSLFACSFISLDLRNFSVKISLNSFLCL